MKLTKSKCSLNEITDIYCQVGDWLWVKFKDTEEEEYAIPYSKVARYFDIQYRS